MAKTSRRTWPVLAVAAILIAAVTLVGCGQSTTTGVKYHCPMHPTFISDKPGDCPICGMRFVPMEEKVAPTTVPAYSCPMHAEVTSDRPGRCSRCGMKLVPTGSGGDYAREHKTYTCPMHPEFLTDDPNERCPTCGMQVVETGPRNQRSGIGSPTRPVNTLPAATSAAGSVRTPGPGPVTPGGGRTVAYYRNPMNPKVTSPVPMKDEMGMDYVPVYAEQTAPAGVGVVGMATVEISPEGIRLSGVQTEPAVEGTLGRTIRTVGTVVPDETRIQHFHTRVSGWVEKLYVNFTGQFVEVGQPMISIYSPELLASQEEFLRARDAAALFATSALAEVRKGGEELLAAARRRLSLFEVPEEFIEELERSGKAQREVTLVAHASGYVTSKGIFHGQQVDPSMMDLFTITDLSHVWIDADFYEYEAGTVSVGEWATVALAYDPALRLRGRVAYVYPTLNPETRTIRVRFDFSNPGIKLKPGMFADVELRTEGSRGVIVPESAVIDTGERQVIFVSLGGGRFEPREVKLGVRGSGEAQVLSGVAAGEQVVTRANFLLDSESQLRAAIAAIKNPSDGKHGGGQ